MSSAQKILLVFGATGKQGGSVIKSVLSDKNASELFRIRGVTRGGFPIVYFDIDHPVELEKVEILQYIGNLKADM
jgi:uncharacterized protein YbjT (DUF2867 family)